MTADVLEGIIAATRRTVADRRAASDGAELEARAHARRAHDPPRGFARALAGPGVAVIAEHKRRSPSAGPIREGSALETVVGAYHRGGAEALSVLTEGPHFGGALADLAVARAVCPLPILRKDFIVDEWQLLESLAAGADAVLLIAAALADPVLGSLHAAARALGLDVLVEVHDRAELDRALAVSPALIGINNRDLRTLSVDVERTFALLEVIPAGAVVVSESGIGDPAQIRRLGAAGVGAVLVGERLMRAADPEQALLELRPRG